MNPDDLSFTGKIKAASKGKLKVVDGDGCVFWIDTYDPEDETAYIHQDEGDTHLIGWNRLKEHFNFVPADNSHLDKNDYQL